MTPQARRWWAALAVLGLLMLMIVLLIRMSSPRQPGMPGTGTINYGTPVSPADPRSAPPSSSMPGMQMGVPGGK